MKPKHNKIFSVLTGLLFVFVGVTATACDIGYDDSPRITKKYLLTGKYVGNEGIFDYYSIGDNEYAVSLKDGAEVPATINVPEVYTVDEKDYPVTGIWHNAFHNCSATTINLTSNIRTIDFEAFLYSKITSITIPYSIDQIGDAAFYACSDLTTVTFQNSNDTSSSSSSSAIDCVCNIEQGQGQGQQQQIDPQYCDLEEIPMYCFFKCNSLTTLTLPGSIQAINEEAFNGCYNLSSTIFFQKIKTIRSRAFQGCTALRFVYISTSMFDNASGPGIEPHAFNFCHDTLRIFFCGQSGKIEAWLGNHEYWGWRKDIEDPDASGNSYGYEHIDGDTYVSSDWQYSVEWNATDEIYDVKLIGYRGPRPTNGYISVPNSMDDFPHDNRVTFIQHDIFDNRAENDGATIKSSLNRFYLPTTLKAIDNLMFRSGYSNLYVVAANTDCATDEGSKVSPGITGRIDLHGLEDLEFIGHRAFAGMGSNAKNNIVELHLPAKIRSIGNEAFGIFGQAVFPKVTTFKWDYNEAEARLETVGAEAFYALGYTAGVSGEIKTNADIANNKADRHKPTTLIFPKTFKYFGMTTQDKIDCLNNYGFDFRDQALPSGEITARQNRPSHAFLACSLINKVIFKGDEEDENATTDLIIPLQTFVYNENLTTIVFEERKGHSITFHTQSGAYVHDDEFKGEQAVRHFCQESIGGNAGRGGNDFRGTPFLQTLVLPNKYTKLRFQNMALHGNSRAVMYLSGTYNGKLQLTGHETEDSMVSDNFRSKWIQYPANNYGENNPLENAVEWRTIGSENYYSECTGSEKGYYGYCFTSQTTGKDFSSDTSINSYGIDQKMPYYENVHYKDVVEDDEGNTLTTVEVGKGNPNEYVTTTEVNDDKAIEKYAFVCSKDGNNGTAIMTKYLYNAYDDTTDNQKITAKVPETVSATFYKGTEDETTISCKVWKIGDSAFSACFCDGKDTVTDRNPGTFADLTNIVLPNDITDIGEYAFIRAYGVKHIFSYSGNDTPVEGMPKKLNLIGRGAFYFCGLEQVLKIPYSCKFYENTVSDHGIASIFSNDLDLRRVTFLSDGNNPSEGFESKYYKVTTYDTKKTGEEVPADKKFACALYSKDSNELTSYKDCLMMVFNRDSIDYKEDSVDTDALDESPTGICLEFNGKYGNGSTKPFMFGAFKMGYWIKSLVFGTTTVDGNTPLAQPLFCAVGEQTGTPKELKFRNGGTHKYIKLFTSYTYDAMTCYLSSISGDIYKLPPSAVNGCENLNEVVIQNPGSAVSFPDGVFENGNANRKYVTKDTSGTIIYNGDNGILDLTGTNYATIGSSTFKTNPSITKFIAPSGSLTIGASAFESCANLTELDFSAITGNLTIGANAFKSSGVTTITWPSNANAVVLIKDEGAFSNCLGLTSIELPVTLGDRSNKDYKIIGKGTFKGCTNLATVTCAGDMPYLRTIGEEAFSGCSALELGSFDFSHMIDLTTINKNAFLNAGVNAESGDIVLPSTLKWIRESAFQGSNVKTVRFTNTTFEGGEIAQNIFKGCPALTSVRFVHDCAKWPGDKGYNAGLFSDCTNLTTLQLPYSFDKNNKGNSIISNDTSVNIYLCQTYNTNQSQEKWRYYNTNSKLSRPIIYYGSDRDDFLNGISQAASGTEENKRTPYWTYVDNNDKTSAIYYLGVVSSDDGTVTRFSSGSTFDKSTETFTLN